MSEQTNLTPGQPTTLHALLVDASTSPPTPLGSVNLDLNTNSTTSDSGSLSTSSVQTDSQGQCTVTFTGGREPTCVSVTDSTHSLSATCNLYVVQAPTYSLELNPTDAWLSYGYPTTLTATLKQNGTSSPVAGETVTFTVRQDGGDGWLLPYGQSSGAPNITLTAQTDENGVAQITYLFGNNTTTVDAASTNQYNATGAYTFQAPDNGGGGGDACTCRYVSSGTPCSCTDSTGCSGDCRDCFCRGEKCRCDNDSQCMGNDSCAACDCGVTGCDCAKKSANCGADCMKCGCGCIDTKPFDHCESKNTGCFGRGGCDDPPKGPLCNCTTTSPGCPGLGGGDLPIHVPSDCILRCRRLGD